MGTSMCRNAGGHGKNVRRGTNGRGGTCTVTHTTNKNNIMNNESHIEYIGVGRGIRGLKTTERGFMDVCKEPANANTRDGGKKSQNKQNKHSEKHINKIRSNTTL